MKQLLLEIVPDYAPTLDNFVEGRNAELLATLRDILAGRQRERMLYVWGDPGSGRSHLLRGFAAAAVKQGLTAIYASAETGAGRLPDLTGHQVVVVDDVDRLDPEAQIGLFHMYNRLREETGILLAAGASPPAQLSMRADLVTRLGWGLVYQIHSLSDPEKVQALQSHAKERGFVLAPGVSDYLLNHWRRDLPSLLGALDALDRYSLETRRPVTVPLLREILRHQVNP